MIFCTTKLEGNGCTTEKLTTDNGQLTTESGEREAEKRALDLTDSEILSVCDQGGCGCRVVSAIFPTHFTVTTSVSDEALSLPGVFSLGLSVLSVSFLRASRTPPSLGGFSTAKSIPMTAVVLAAGPGRITVGRYGRAKLRTATGSVRASVRSAQNFFRGSQRRKRSIRARLLRAEWNSKLHRKWRSL